MHLLACCIASGKVVQGKLEPPRRSSIASEGGSLDQGLNHGGDLEAQDRPLAESVPAHDRVLEARSKVHRGPCDLDRPRAEQADGDVSLFH